MEGSGHRLIRSNEVLSANLPGEAEEGHGSVKVQRWNSAIRHEKVSVKINSTYVEIKCQLDATEVFIADLIACSTCFGHHYAHHQEL